MVINLQYLKYPLTTVRFDLLKKDTVESQMSRTYFGPSDNST